MSKDIIVRQVPTGDFRRMVIGEIRRLLIDARDRAEAAAGEGFVRRDPALLIRHNTDTEIVEVIAMLGASTLVNFPALAEVVAGSDKLAQSVLQANSNPELLELYNCARRLHGLGDDAVGDSFSIAAQQDGITIEASSIGDDPQGSPATARVHEQADQALVAATVNTIAAARTARRPLTRDEQVALATAYRLLDYGVQLPPAFRSIGIYGFREHQTNLSLANPGDGHVSVTCTTPDLLSGTIVHIEHIDRDGVSDREIIEPYRLPAALNAARVRLHTGAAAPCTAYIGRPIFENGVRRRGSSLLLQAIDFDRDLLKSVHTLASACTAMFMNGVADCKVAIERMSFQQAIQFMRALVGNVVRDPRRQYLSAAFNINIPFWDDRGGGELITGRYAIAKLGIDLAVAGRFNKVAWDGASNQVPSQPIIAQLTHAQWVELIHEAHERGLETYMSAGMQPTHMPSCVNTGVDGVGIGTSLHHRHPQTGAIGQLKPDAIRQVLTLRDQAAADLLGRGATQLARLDRLFFEGSLPLRLEPVRQQLFDGVRYEDTEIVGTLLLKIDLHVDEVPTCHPIIARAQRLLVTSNEPTVGAARTSQDAWLKKAEQVESLLHAGDITGIEEALA